MLWEETICFWKDRGWSGWLTAQDAMEMNRAN